MAEAPICITPLEESEEREIKESLKIEQDNKNYLLDIIIKGEIIIFKVSELGELYSSKFSEKMSLKEIRQKEPQQLFSGLNSCNEFLDYLKTLSEMKRLSIIKKEKQLYINFTAEYFVKKYNIEFELLPEKMNLELIIKEICDEIKLIKNKINIGNQNINMNNDLEDKIEEIIAVHNKDINNLKKENEELKNEIINLKNQNESLMDQINKINVAINSINKSPDIDISKLSVIIEEKDYNFIKEAIENTMNKKIKELKKIYQATIDGGEPTLFHKKCDGIYNTLTIIKSESNKKFGGFSKENWETLNWISKNGNNSFLFSLDKQKIYPNINKENGIWCNKICGPSFGYDEILIDGNPIKEKKLILLSSDKKEKYGYNYFGDNNPFLEKTNQYIYSLEIEVFQIIFS